MKRGTIIIFALEQRDDDLENFLKHAVPWVQSGKLVMKMVREKTPADDIASPVRMYECYVVGEGAGGSGGAGTTSAASFVGRDEDCSRQRRVGGSE